MRLIPQLSHLFTEPSRCILFILACAFVSIAHSASASDAPETETLQRPKIGLVLSGGGARGGAHLGVLRVLEEQRVPVDAIAGTSIGALVGALYASGLSVDEVEKALLDTDWDQGYYDKPPRKTLSFRKKREADSFLIDTDIGFSDGQIKLPKGLIQGQTLSQILNQLTQHTAHINDFDDFPIPFRAVAADISTGEQVVLSRGNLATALQASMSVPGILKPTQIDGRLLVDGGIASNVPVNVVREMGVDVIIAVDISTPLLKENQIESVVGVIEQLTNLLTRRNAEEEIGSLGTRDLLITPDLSAVATTSFNNLGAAVEPGEKAARVYEERLQRLSLDESAYAQLRQQQANISTNSPTIDAIVIENSSDLSDETIRQRVSQQVGEPLDPKQLKKDLQDVYGMDYFERVDYTLGQVAGETNLFINADAKSWGPHYLDFGLRIEDNFDGISNYTLGTRYTLTELNPLGAEWRNELQIGNRPGIRSEFYQPLDYKSDLFLSAVGEVFRQNIRFENDDSLNAELETNERVFGLDLGWNFENWGQARIGARRGKGEQKLLTGEFPELNLDGAFDSGFLFTSFQYDSLDNFHFPRHGEFASVYLQMNREYLGHEENFDEASITFAMSRSWGRHSLILQTEAASLLTDDEENPAAIQTLGGFLNLSGYNRNQLVGFHKRFGALIYFYHFGEGFGSLDFPIYAGGSIERGGVWADRDDISWTASNKAGSLFLGTETPLGPIYLGYGRNEESQDAVYLFLGSYLQD